MARILRFPDGAVLRDHFRAIRSIGFVVPEDSLGVKRAKGALSGVVTGAFAVAVPKIIAVTCAPNSDAAGIGVGLLTGTVLTAMASLMGFVGVSHSKRAMLVGAFAGAAAAGVHVYPAVSQLILSR